MFLKSFVLLSFVAVICDCYHDDNYGVGVKGRSGYAIKSYGGYFPESGSIGDSLNADTRHYHQTIAAPYQPYGWNFNQPSRTYGGVNVLQTPRFGYNTNNYGWANANGLDTRIGQSTSVPQLPSLFQPNFVPPVYYPSSFSYPSFSSYPNLFPQYFPNFGYNQGPVYPNSVSSDGSVISQQPGGIANRPVVNTIGGAAGGGGVLNQGEVIPNAAGGGGSSTSGGSNNAGGSSGGGGGSGNSQSSGGGGGSSSGGGSGSSSGGGGSSSGNNNAGGGGSTFSSGNFDSSIGASNQLDSHALHHNPFYTPTREPQRPLYTQHGPPYPQRPIYPDQSAFESNNQHAIHHQQSTTESSRPTDFSRFPSNSLLTENRRGEWTEEDEMRWQATTKAPYFENKAPVLGCTLPAAAVLGAMSALKVSSLLPLNVPSGKPILSCNATDLLQAQIRLNGKLYDCKSSSIVVSCSSHGRDIDQCRSETLECDVNMRQMDAYSVTCTNGTLVSNSVIVCESATLMVGKNILNCFFKDAVRAPSNNQRPISVIPLATPAPVDEVFEENSLEERGQLTGEENQLMPQVKKAMHRVFPHELLAMPSTMYLPQKQSLQPQISEDLKKQVDDVFKADLLASSQTQKNDEKSSTVSPRLSAIDTERISANWRDQAQLQWAINSNIKNAPSGTKTKVSERFGGGAAVQHDLRDRLIFTD